MNRFTQDRLDLIGISQPAARMSVADLLKDCVELDILDELRAALALQPRSDSDAALRVVRDLVYELACAQNRDLAVDALICATGIAEFGHTSLRSYSRKHGITPEGFRLQVRALQSRLHLSPRTPQNLDAN